MLEVSLFAGVAVKGSLTDSSGALKSFLLIQQDQSLRLEFPKGNLIFLVRNGKSYVVDSVSGFAMDTTLLADQIRTTNGFEEWFLSRALKPTSLKLFLAGYVSQAFFFQKDKKQNTYLFFSKDAVLRALFSDVRKLLVYTPASAFALPGTIGYDGVLLAIQQNGRFVMRVTQIKPATFGERLFELPPKGQMTMNEVIQHLKELH